MTGSRASLWLVAGLTAAAAAAFAWNWSSTSLRPIVRTDPEGYYVYLPGIVADHDPSLKTVSVRRWHDDPSALSAVGLRRDPVTGDVIDKFGVGTALTEAPLFAAGHLLATATGDPGDGYSDLEQRTAALTGVVAGLLGMLVLRGLLLRIAQGRVVAGALACVCLGTSLFNYMGYDSGFSHAAAFAAITLTMLAAARWWARPDSLWRAVQAGACAGLVTLIRPTDALAVAPLALIGVETRSDLRRRLRAGWAHRDRVAAAALTGLLVFAPQVAEWHAQTGRWVISPYPPDEGFNLLHPNVGALVSWNPHGLLPYAPVLLLVVPGAAVLWRQHRAWFWPVAVGIGAQTYVIATWHAWWYGHAFGHRGFVDVAAYFALPIAAFLGAARTGWQRAAGGLAAGALTLTTILAVLAYWRGRIPLNGIDPRGYLHALLG